MSAPGPLNTPMDYFYELERIFEEQIDQPNHPRVLDPELAYSNMAKIFPPQEANFHAATLADVPDEVIAAVTASFHAFQAQTLAGMQPSLEDDLVGIVLNYLPISLTTDSWVGEALLFDIGLQTGVLITHEDVQLKGFREWNDYYVFNPALVPADAQSLQDLQASGHSLRRFLVHLSRKIEHDMVGHLAYRCYNSIQEINQLDRELPIVRYAPLCIRQVREALGEDWFFEASDWKWLSLPDRSNNRWGQLGEFLTSCLPSC